MYKSRTCGFHTPRSFWTPCGIYIPPVSEQHLVSGHPVVSEHHLVSGHHVVSTHHHNDCIIASLPLYAARVTLHYRHVFPRKNKTETLESMINLFEARR
jgi:hypothetical protein